MPRRPCIKLVGMPYTLIKQRQRDACFKAFLHNNWLGLAVFIGIAAAYLLRS